jgi:hypothetical protein
VVLIVDIQHLKRKKLSTLATFVVYLLISGFIQSQFPIGNSDSLPFQEDQESDSDGYSYDHDDGNDGSRTQTG